jgi:hypothetical protein
MANSKIKWIIIMEYEFVHVVNLETTQSMCNQNASNKKDMFFFDLVGLNAKNANAILGNLFCYLHH